MKRKSNFDQYLKEQLKDEGFAERFKKAGEAWDVALELAALRKESGLSQKELAKRVGTTQQQISRLESTSYEGHSLSMLRRVAEAFGATIHIELLRGKPAATIGPAAGSMQERKLSDLKEIIRNLPRLEDDGDAFARDIAQAIALQPPVGEGNPWA